MYARIFLRLLMPLTLVVLIGAACSGGQQQRPTSVSQPVQRTPTPAPLPDLTITNVEVDPPPTIRADGVQFLHRGTSYTISVEVTNIGLGIAQGAIVVDAPFGCPGHGRSPNQLFVSSNLSPGQSQLSKSFTVTLRDDSGGNCSFTFTVDPDNVHRESNDSSSSNTREFIFQVP